MNVAVGVRGILAALSVAAGFALLAGECVQGRAHRRVPVRSTQPGGSTGVAVVLGFANRGDRANLVNRWRARIAVRTACSAVSRGCRVTIVCSGGAVRGENSEASLLADVIRRHERWTGPLITETASTTTWENVRNAVPFIECCDWVAFASSSLHAERAGTYLARQRPELAHRLTRADSYGFGEMSTVKLVEVLLVAIRRRVPRGTSSF